MVYDGRPIDVMYKEIDDPWLLPALEFSPDQSKATPLGLAQIRKARRDLRPNGAPVNRTVQRWVRKKGMAWALNSASNQEVSSTKSAASRPMVTSFWRMSPERGYLMSSFMSLPPELREALYHCWDPAKGLPADAIRTLLPRVQCTAGRIAQECGVTSHYVQHVITRIRRSSKVESCITRHMLALGITQEIIWGVESPKRPSVREVPSGFDGVPAFIGRLIKGQHEIVLLAGCMTSGPNEAIHRAVEVALLQVVFDRRPEGGYRLLGVLDGYTGLQDPGPNPVNPASMSIHGIPIDQLIGQRLDVRRIRRLISGSSMVIAHNAEFDHRFLRSDFPEVNERLWLCSLRGVAWKDFGFTSGKLRELAQSLNFSEPGYRAPGDTVALYHLLDARLPDGRTTLAHLISSPTACLRF